MVFFPGAGLYPSKIGGDAGAAGHPAAPCTPAYFSSSMQSAYGPQGNFSKTNRVVVFCGRRVFAVAEWKLQEIIASL